MKYFVATSVAKFYTIDGYKINIEVLGDGPPILFLAGGPGNSHDYMQGSFGQYYKTNKVILLICWVEENRMMQKI